MVHFVKNITISKAALGKPLDCGWRGENNKGGFTENIKLWSELEATISSYDFWKPEEIEPLCYDL